MSKKINSEYPFNRSAKKFSPSYVEYNIKKIKQRLKYIDKIPKGKYYLKNYGELNGK